MSRTLLYKLQSLFLFAALVNVGVRCTGGDSTKDKSPSYRTLKSEESLRALKEAMIRIAKINDQLADKVTAAIQRLAALEAPNGLIRRAIEDAFLAASRTSPSGKVPEVFVQELVKRLDLLEARLRRLEQSLARLVQDQGNSTEPIKLTPEFEVVLRKFIAVELAGRGANNQKADPVVNVPAPSSNDSALLRDFILDIFGDSELAPDTPKAAPLAPTVPAAAAKPAHAVAPAAPIRELVYVDVIQSAGFPRCVNTRFVKSNVIGQTRGGMQREGDLYVCTGHNLQILVTP